MASFRRFRSIVMEPATRTVPPGGFVSQFCAVGKGNPHSPSRWLRFAVLAPWARRRRNPHNPSRWLRFAVCAYWEQWRRNPHTPSRWLRFAVFAPSSRSRRNPHSPSRWLRFADCVTRPVPTEPPQQQDDRRLQPRLGLAQCRSSHIFWSAMPSSELRKSSWILGNCCYRV